jgi:predicted nucleic acid-binding protein
LYDIRLYLKNNHTDIFHKLIEKDHNFWIARSTINNIH